jgi:hypothetical protein
VLDKGLIYVAFVSVCLTGGVAGLFWLLIVGLERLLP